MGCGEAAGRVMAGAELPERGAARRWAEGPVRSRRSTWRWR